MNDYDPWRVQRRYFSKAYSDSAVEFLCCFLVHERQLVKFISEKLPEFLQLQIIAIHKQVSSFLPIFFGIMSPNCGFVIMQKEIPIRNIA